MFDPTLEQTLFDSDAQSVGAGEHQLTVDVPTCYFQAEPNSCGPAAATRRAAERLLPRAAAGLRHRRQQRVSGGLRATKSPPPPIPRAAAGTGTGEHAQNLFRHGDAMKHRQRCVQSRSAPLVRRRSPRRRSGRCRCPAGGWRDTPPTALLLVLPRARPVRVVVLRGEPAATSRRPAEPGRRARPVLRQPRQWPDRRSLGLCDTVWPARCGVSGHSLPSASAVICGARGAATSVMKGKRLSVVRPPLAEDLLVAQPCAATTPPRAAVVCGDLATTVKNACAHAPRCGRAVTARARDWEVLR